MKKRVEPRHTAKKIVDGTPVSVIAVGETIYMLCIKEEGTKKSLYIAESSDGVSFYNPRKSVIRFEKKIENLTGCSGFSLSRIPSGFVLTYIKERPRLQVGTHKTSERALYICRSKDMLVWDIKTSIPALDSTKSYIIYDRADDYFHLYRDGLFIRHQKSHTLALWREVPKLLFTSRHGQFDEGALHVLGSLYTERGILLCYDASYQTEKYTLLQVGGILFDKNYPTHILWRGGMPIWQGVFTKSKTDSVCKPLGMATTTHGHFFYWVTESGAVVTAHIPLLFASSTISLPTHHVLKRVPHNPVLSPRETHEWEVEGTFNPAAVEDDMGVIHVLYRAIGRDGVSRVGSVRTKNGTHFFGRSEKPVFDPEDVYHETRRESQYYHPGIYTSGGSWGGCEDPRLVRMGNRIYMMYTSFAGWDAIRIALTSISLADFKAGRWRWRKPQLISPAGEIHKNWLLFPEKIGGRFAILHSISPKISVDYVDDLDSLGKDKVIQSKSPSGGREGYWDNKMRGGGPPPIKTDIGWLLLYHAMDKYDPNKYKLGAMILDLKDPTKILYRASHPILSPMMHYENDGKPGVVYASGAVIKNGTLYVYYGGGDKVVAVAHAPLQEFLDFVISGKTSSYMLSDGI